MRPLLFAAALLLPLPALAAEGYLQGLYDGYPLCLIASVEGPAVSRLADAESVVPPELGGRDWQVVTLAGAVAVAQGSAPVMGECGCLEMAQVSLAPLPAVAGPALAGNLPLGLPAKLQPLAVDSPAYVKAARAWLDAQGLQAAPVRLTQVIRTDLEGDGVDEVLLAGAYNLVANADADPARGRYAFLLLRQLVKGQVMTGLLAADSDPAPYTHEDMMGAVSAVAVLAVVDVDGDGVAEVATTLDSWEGITYGLYRLEQGAPRLVADCGCGC